MRLSRRPRRYVRRATLAIFGPLLAHDEWRDAFVLRGVGERHGPVLRPNRRRRQDAYTGPERRGDLPAAVSRSRLWLAAITAFVVLDGVALVVTLMIAGHGQHAAGSAPLQVTPVAGVRRASVTTRPVSSTRLPARRRTHPRPVHRVHRAHRPHRVHRAHRSHGVHRARRVHHDRATATPTVAASAPPVPAPAPTVTDTNSASPSSASNPSTTAAPATTYSAPATGTLTPAPSTGSAGGTTSATASGGSGTVHGGDAGGGGSGTVHGGG